MIDLGFEPQGRCLFSVHCLQCLNATQSTCGRLTYTPSPTQPHNPAHTQVNAVLDAMPKSTLKPEDEGTELDDSRTYRTM